MRVMAGIPPSTSLSFIDDFPLMLPCKIRTIVQLDDFDSTFVISKVVFDVGKVAESLH